MADSTLKCNFCKENDQTENVAPSDLNLPGKRTFLNQSGNGLRLTLKRFTQSLLLPIVKTLRLSQFIARKG